MAFIGRENTMRQNSGGLLMLILGLDMEKIHFRNMKDFLPGEFSGYPTAKNLIPILAFINWHNQRGILLQKNVENRLNLNDLSINK